MKKLTYLLISFTLLSTASYAQLIQGQIAFGGTNSDDATSIVQTKDGGYAAAGVTESFGLGFYGLYVTNFDNKGQLKWAKTICGTGLDQGYSIVQSKDGGFGITGYTNSFTPPSSTESVWVIKLDSNGNKVWTESIGGTKADQGKCIINTKDGGFAIGGYSGSFGSGGPSDFYVIVLDANGAIKWTKTIGGSADEEAYTIIQCKDGGFALTGYTLSYGAGNADVYVVKLDSVGNLKWTRTVGGPLGDAGWGICETYDKGYAITGYEAETTFGAGSDDVYIIKLDSLGNLKWTKTVGGTGNDQGQAIIQTKDSGLVIAGFTNSFGAGGTDVYLLKVSSTGTLLWTRAAGGTSNEEGSALTQTSDGGFAVAGFTDSYGAGGDDFYIVKFDSNGNTCGSSEIAGGTVGTGGTASSGGSVSSGGAISYKDSGRIIEGGTIDTVCRVLKRNTSGINTIAADLSTINLYPNPCTNTLHVDAGDLVKNSDLKIQVLDITGRVLLTENLQTLSNNFTINISSLSSGMYFMNISSGNGTTVKKFMKE